MPGAETGGDSGRLRAYFRQVQKTRPLPRAEERRLAVKIRQGDVEARNALVTANLRFALDVARSYQGRGLPLEDLVSFANLGLMEAAGRFDGDSGVRFITYAVWWIRQSVLKAIAGERRLVRLPGHVTELQQKIRRTSEGLLQDLGRAPEADEIASRLGRPARAILAAQACGLPVQSIDDLTGGRSERRRLTDGLPDPAARRPLEELEREDEHRRLRRSIRTLDKREATVLSRYYGLDGQLKQNLAEIGRELGLSRERIRQIRDGALRRMRRRLSARDVVAAGA